jgi:solute carrier family 45 protein 1/2/4
LDVTVPDDHARGLSTFTIMAGMGGSLGYALGAINWDVTALGAILGGHVRAVFTLITFIFTICVAITVTSFKEIPLHLLESQKQVSVSKERTEFFQELMR